MFSNSSFTSAAVEFADFFTGDSFDGEPPAKEAEEPTDVRSLKLTSVKLGSLEPWEASFGQLRSVKRQETVVFAYHTVLNTAALCCIVLFLKYVCMYVNGLWHCSVSYKYKKSYT